MLRSFRVANHKSIRDEAELLLMPAYDKTRPVVPVAGIFGANASGKSNLLDALAWMRYAVLNSFAAWQPESGVPREPFRLDPTGPHEPSCYVITIIVDGVRYTYGFVVDSEQVREEWLYTYPHNRKRVVFEREGDTWTFGAMVNQTGLERASQLTRGSALFLSVAARSNQHDVQSVYRWFHDGLRFAQDDSDVRGLMDKLEAGAPDRKTIVDLLRAADLGITDVVVDHPSEVRQVLGFQASLRFHHGDSEATLGLDEQSAGTRSWLSIISAVVGALDAGSILAIDEIHASLHPALTARLIELFGSDEMNPRHAQLVFTTQDSALLGPMVGDDVLARDEIWFVEKDPRLGTTKLFALSDFHPRKDENRERRYLAGSYGAVPIVSEWEFLNVLRDHWDAHAAA